MHKKEGAAQKNAAIALARLAKDGSCLVNVRVFTHISELNLVEIRNRHGIELMYHLTSKIVKQ